MIRLDKEKAREYGALFIFSLSLLAIQASFTKFFSIVLWYHFGYMIISVAMLGFSVSGIFLSLCEKFSKKFSFSGLISASSFVTFVSYILLTRLSFTAKDFIFQRTGLFSLLSMVILLFVPFFLFGLTIGWILRERKLSIGKYYGINMTGSAAGAIAFIILFNNFNGYIVVPLIAFFMAVAAFIASDNLKQRLTASVISLIIFPSLFLPSLFPMNPPGDKILGLVEDKKNDVIFTGWSALSKVDAIKDPDRSTYRSIGLWGLSHPFTEEGFNHPERIGIVIDSWAYTSILKYPQDFSFLNYMPSTLVYQLGGKIDSSLHIGAGGGMDLLAAKYFDVEKITGVEINPVIVKAVQEEFKDYSGGIYSGKIEGIEIVVDEGRNFIESSDAEYDMIQLSGVDTFSSTHAGAFALSENNLYTVEAFKSYYQKLKDNGYFTMTSWFSPDEKGTPRFSVRLLNIVRQALNELGVSTSDKVIFMVSDVYTLLVLKKGALTKDEIDNSIKYIKKNRFVPLIIPYDNSHPDNVFEKFLNAGTSETGKMESEYPYMVSPPTDDKPFFFELRKLDTLFSGINSGVLPLNVFSGQTVLFSILAIILILGLIFIVAPLLILKKKNKTVLKTENVLYFSAIGLGFMFVEIVLTQKLVLYLGHPSYSLSIALFSILLFSGIGSYFSNASFFKKRYILFILLGFLLFMILFMSPVLSLTLGASFIFRVMITIILLAPLAFFMGLAFPAAARQVQEKELPFFWGINGFFSLVASVSAIIISINFGFTSVFYLSFICYLCAALIMFFKFTDNK